MGMQVASLFGVLELVDKFTGPLNAAEKNTQNFGKGVGGAIQKVNMLSAAMGALPGAAFLIGAVKTASDYEKTMTNVGAVMGKTKDQMTTLNAQVLEMGKNSIAGPQKAAEAFYDIVGGVSDASTHMAILEAAMKTSEAGAADLGSTTQGLISVMNSYKYGASKATQVSDILTQTVGKGVGSMDAFVAAIGPIAGTSAAAGVGFKEMASSLAYMTTKGTSAAQASTQFKAATVALLNPNAQMAAALKKTGAASGSALIQQYGLVGALNKLKTASGGSMDAMAKMLGSVEALQAATALTGDGFKDFAQTFETGLTGATDAARNIQLGSFDAQFTIFKNNLLGVAIAAGNVLLPALTALFSIFNGLMTIVNAFDPNLLGLVAAFTALGVVIPALLPILASIAGVIAPLLIPIALLAGAFTAVKLAWDADFGGIRTSLTKLWTDIQPAIAQIKTGIDTFFNILNTKSKTELDLSGLDANQARFTKKMSKLGEGDGMKTTEFDFGTRLKSAVDTAWPIIEPAINLLLSKVKGALKGLAIDLMNAMAGEIEKIDWEGFATGVTTSLITALSGNGTKAINTLSNEASNGESQNAFSRAGQRLGEALLHAFEGAVKGIFMSIIGNEFKNIASNDMIPDALVKMITGLDKNGLKLAGDMMMNGGKSGSTGNYNAPLTMTQDEKRGGKYVAGEEGVGAHAGVSTGEQNQGGIGRHSSTSKINGGPEQYGPPAPTVYSPAYDPLSSIKVPTQPVPVVITGDEKSGGKIVAQEQFGPPVPPGFKSGGGGSMGGQSMAVTIMNPEFMSAMMAVAGKSTAGAGDVAPQVSTTAQGAATVAGQNVAAGGQNPAQPIVEAAVSWLQTIGAQRLTEGFTAAMQAGVAAFKSVGAIEILSGVQTPMLLAQAWLNTVGRAGFIITFAGLAAAANNALGGVGSAMVSSVVAALVAIANKISALPGGVGVALGTGILEAAGRARGGAIGAGRYLIGEHGPELVDIGTGQSGNVYENSLVRGSRGGGSSGGMSITLQNPVFQGVQDPVSLLTQLQETAGRYNMALTQSL